jgi:hypothetical protein
VSGILALHGVRVDFALRCGAVRAGFRKSSFFQKGVPGVKLIQMFRIKECTGTRLFLDFCSRRFLVLFIYLLSI